MIELGKSLVWMERQKQDHCVEGKVILVEVGDRVLTLRLFSSLQVLVFNILVYLIITDTTVISCNWILICRFV